MQTHGWHVARVHRNGCTNDQTRNEACACFTDRYMRSIAANKSIRTRNSQKNKIRVQISSRSRCGDADSHRSAPLDGPAHARSRRETGGGKISIGKPHKDELWRTPLHAADRFALRCLRARSNTSRYVVSFRASRSGEHRPSLRTCAFSVQAEKRRALVGGCGRVEGSERALCSTDASTAAFHNLP